MIYRVNRCCVFLGGVAAGTILFGAPAVAQTAATPGEPQLEEVVVTAQRTQTDLQNTPVAVTAFGESALAEKGARTLLDVANFTPNVVIGSRSGAGTNSGGVAIRGIGVDGGSQAAVGIYIDDVYYPSSAANLLSLIDIDRLEVLRGPQGTLFGRNTIGGAIQYITVKPSNVFGGFVEAIGGSHSRADFHGAVNLPLGDTFAVRLTLASDDNGGYVKDSITDRMRGADHSKMGRVQARWTPTDRFTMDVKAEGTEERTNGRAIEVHGFNNNAQFVGLAVLNSRGALPRNPLTSAVNSTRDWQFPGFNSSDYFHADYHEGQAIEAFKATDTITLKSITAYSWTRTRSVTDIDDTPVQIISALGGPITTELWTQEFQATGNSFSDRLKWTVGYYYYDSDATNIGALTQLGVKLPTNPPFNASGNTEVKIKANAGYGQATYNFTDQWSVLGGVRYSKEDTEARNLTFTQFDAKQSFTDTSPAIGLNFQFDPNTLFYVKASKGFRAGGATASAAVPGGFLFFGPETAWTYEAGARLEFLDKRLRINPTVFYTDWKNLQFNRLIPINTTVLIATQNAGDATIKGGELEAQFAATERLLFTGSVSLLDGHYTFVDPAVIRQLYLNGFPGPATRLPNLTTADDMQRSPKYKIAAGGRYTQPFANGSNLVGSLDYSYTAKQRSAVTDSDFEELPAFGLLNGRLQYNAPNGRWSAAFYGTNLTDKHYYIGGVDFAFGYTTGAVELDPARPREFGIDLRANL